MKRTILLLLLTFLSLQSILSQDIRIQIFDFETRDPIAYTNVYANNWGNMTDFYGTVNLKINEISKFDSLTISNIGYWSKTISVDALIKLDVRSVELKKKKYEIKEALITAERSKKTIKKGVYKKQSYGAYGNSGISGFKVALYIENDKNRKGIIKNLQYFINKCGRPTDLFRIHILEAKGKDFQPGKELLPESIFVSAEKDNSWVVVDVRKYNIEYPKDGFFIAIEMLENERDIEQKKVKGFEVSGDKLNLGMNGENMNEGYTWLLYYPKREWEQRLPYNKDTRVGNAMMAAEILIY